MKLSLKLVPYLTAFSSLLIIESTMADPRTCPVLNKTELKQLCRWKALSKIPGLKIQAGQVTVEGTTLINKLGTCGESDSVKAFFSKDPSKTYEGMLAKNPADINNSNKGLCLYKIDSLAGNKRDIAFEVTFPSEISIVKPTTGPKTVQGVDITSSPEIQSVKIHKENTHQNPTPPSTRPVTPQVVSPAGRPVPPTAMKANQPPLAAPSALPETVTEKPGSKPPTRKPPAAPTPSPADGANSKTSPSNANVRGMVFQNKTFTNEKNEQKLRDAEGD